MLKNKNDYSKEFIRGSIKEMLKSRGLRAISFANYAKWSNTPKHKVHTVNINLENGYIRFYRFNNNPENTKRGEIMEDISLGLYKETYSQIKEILSKEHEIPAKVRRNILVNMYR